MRNFLMGAAVREDSKAELLATLLKALPEIGMLGLTRTDYASQKQYKYPLFRTATQLQCTTFKSERGSGLT